MVLGVLVLMWLDAGVYVMNGVESVSFDVAGCRGVGMNGVGSVSFDVAGCRGVGMNTIEMLLILM